MSDPAEGPPRRRRRQQPPPPQGSIARGAALVVLAVVIGIVLLRDDDASVAQVSVGAETTAPTDTRDDGSTPGDGTSPTTASTVAARPPSQVKVLVANGSTVNGAAGSQTDQLEALGYVTATPTNAAQRVPATIIYYVAGFEAEAAALAEALGVPETQVTAMPTPAPVDDLQLASVLVVVGPDLATSG